MVKKIVGFLWASSALIPIFISIIGLAIGLIFNSWKMFFIGITIFIAYLIVAKYFKLDKE